MDERLPTQLSGGQQQRVAVARALAHRPEVLLLDEPFGALDAKIREELRRTIRQIQQELGVSTILVTHDQDEAFAMADRIGVMHQGRLLEVGTPDALYASPRTRFVATFLGAANLLLGYRRGNRMDFERPGAETVTPREIVAVIRPEEVELTTGAPAAGLTLVGTGIVQELQFAGATERLRVRMPMEGPVPATPDREGADGSNWLLDASRSFPEQRANPLAIGQKVTVSARRIHSLPTPISSFTVIAREAAAADALRDTPLLAALATRMQTRITTRTTRTASAPPGMPVLAAGAGAARRRSGTSRTAPRRSWCCRSARRCPTRIVVLPGAEAGVGSLGVAASLLRHIPAESVLLAIHEASTPERERASRLRILLDSRSRAQTEHGLDLRTELRFGDPDEELARELTVDPNSMLVIGIDSLDADESARLKSLLEGTQQRAVLIVRAPDGTG